MNAEKRKEKQIIKTKKKTKRKTKENFSFHFYFNVIIGISESSPSDFYMNTQKNCCDILHKFTTKIKNTRNYYMFYLTHLCYVCEYFSADSF